MCGFLPPAGVSCALLAERRAARASRTEARAGMGGACGVSARVGVHPRRVGSRRAGAKYSGFSRRGVLRWCSMQPSEDPLPRPCGEPPGP